MKLLAVLLSATAVIGQSPVLVAAQPVEQRWTPTLEQVSQLETMVGMPRGTKPLAQYTRAYHGVMIGGHPYIKALYYIGSRSVPGVEIIGADRTYPMILDGGCNVVNLTYEVESRDLAIRCNGQG